MKYFLGACFLLWATFCLGQAKPNYSTKNKKAIELFETGKFQIQQRKFYEAAESFTKALEKDDQFVESYIALAGLYRVLREDAKVKQYLLAAFKVKPDMPEAPYEYYALAVLLMREGDYKNASTYLDKFLSLNPTDKRAIPIAKQMQKNSVFAQEAVKRPLQFTPVTLEPPLNQFQTQYFPSLTADNQYMLYTVRMVTKFQEEENLYVTTLKGGKWETPQLISDKINTLENEGASSISGDGKTLVYTFCTPRNRCDLYITTKVDNEWTPPVSISGKVNTSGWESHPSLSADGRTLYFSSDRGGGMGKEDIWVTHLDTANVWTKPVNAGPSINTEDSDITPFIHANGSTLYFSSRGHVGMGGADLFKSERLGDSAWSAPKNLGYPLNTFEDESGLFVTSDFSLGYFSKDYKEKNGRYASKLYSFPLSDSLKSNVRCIYLKGKVLDSETKKPVAAKIELTDLRKEVLEQSVVSDGQTGDYLVVLPIGKNYGLFASSPGYLYKSLHFNTGDDAFSSSESFVIYLQPIKKNSTAILNNLFFETGKYNLDQTSETELNKLANLIKDNHLTVEISGHTDNVGAALDNQTLSEKRAQAVVNYLKTLGIDKLKLRAKGYGATKPVGDNTTEEGRRNNRRIEIKIIE